MTVTKNQIVLLTITGMTAQGSGVGHIDDENGQEGLAVFVPYTTVGDRIECRIVRVEKRFAYGIIERLLIPSEDRLSDHACTVYGKCGGCCFRHVRYEAELRYKRQRVIDAFERIGRLTVTVGEIIGSTSFDHYRNKAQFPVAGKAKAPQIGFFAPRSHRVVPQRCCPLQPAVFSAVLDEVAVWMQQSGASPYDERTGKGLVRHIYLRQAAATGELMVCLICTCGKLPRVPLLLERLRAVGASCVCVNINRRDTNVILGDTTFSLFGGTSITDELCGLRFRLSVQSFYQVNRDQAETLYRLAAQAAALKKEDTLLDLYCGTGTIGLSMAHLAGQVIGVEIVLQAVEDARRNVEENGITNARFLCADAAEAAAQLEKEGVKADVILLDPPRKGCDAALIDTVVRMSPARVVYVSCDPATLARDCALFVKKGYTIAHITPVDMFPRTAHVETLVLLTKQQFYKVL